MTELILKTQRTATIDEVRDLIFGTGALSMPWWAGAHETAKGFRFEFDHPDHQEGTFKGRRWVSHQAILNAAAKYLAEGRGGEDAADMISDSIGYADAEAADTILQYAVLGAGVYG